MNFCSVHTIFDIALNFLRVDDKSGNISKDIISNSEIEISHCCTNRFYWKTLAFQQRVNSDSMFFIA